MTATTPQIESAGSGHGPFPMAIPEAFARRLSAVSALGGRPDPILRELTLAFAERCRLLGLSAQEVEDALARLVRARIPAGSYNAPARRGALIELLRHWARVRRVPADV